MPVRQLADAGAQSTVSAAINNTQTSVTLQSASGFPAILAGGQLSVTILDSGNPAYNPLLPLATPYEYQQVNAVSGNVLTFGPGGGAAARSSYAGTTPHAFFAGATVAAGLLAEDIVASAPWKFDEQTPSGVASIRIPTSGSIPASYLGVNWRHLAIRVLARGDTAAQNTSLYLQFNGDTAANYLWEQFYGNNSVASAGQGLAATGQPQIGLVTSASGVAGFCSDISIEIANFAGTTFNKIAKGWTVSFEDNAATHEWIVLRGLSWSNTAAITSVTVGLVAGLYVTGSVITTELRP